MDRGRGDERIKSPKAVGLGIRLEQVVCTPADCRVDRIVS
jgi:hypothetical protein